MRFPFSARTTGYLVEAIASAFTQASMQTLFLKAEVDEWSSTEGSKEAIAQKLLRNLRAAGTDEARTGVLELARLILAAAKPVGPPHDPAPRWWTNLKDALAADGWDFDAEGDVLVPSIPSAPMVEEISWIERELIRRQWATAVGHYRQAIENFGDGNWAAANGQLRSFYESLLRTAAGNSTSRGSGQVQVAFDTLDSQGILLAGEADFGKKLWGLLHPGGSHPGLSHEHESHFRLLALTGYARFLLSRLPG